MAAVITVSMPSVTMNGGSRIQVTSVPFSAPTAAQSTTASTSAATGEPLIAILPAMSVPMTAIEPLARSIPAVRMISVWPSASVPITTACSRISVRLSVVRNVSVVAENTTTASTSASSGPTDGVRSARPRPWTTAAPAPPRPASGGVLTVCVMGRQPQQFFRPQAVPFDGRPFTGLSVMSWAPVSMNPDGFFFDLA